jgi:hypothetical protein
MHYRRFACFVLGLWFAGGLFMMMVATQNFRAVDRLLAAPVPAATQQIDALGKNEARMFLRHQVGEQNRWYFDTWEKLQLGLGALLLLTLFFAANGKPSMVVLSLLMLVAVGLQHWLMTPQIVELGRAIDFVPEAKPSPERIRLWDFHAAYTATEVAKLGLGLFLTGRLLVRRRRRSRDVADEIDSINDADNGHVDR